MPSDPIIVGGSGAGNRPRSPLADVGQAWEWIGWFSLVLTAAGLGDWVLAWTPLRLGSPEWEFGTVVASFSGLPLVSMGFAGLLGSAVARGVRWQVTIVSLALLFWAALILAALAVFALDVPVAFASVTGPARIGIIKATTKTVFLGLLFSAGYLVAAIGALQRRR